MASVGLLLYVIIKGSVSAIFALLATVISLRQSATFRHRRYWFWLLGAICFVFLAPLFYIEISSYPISYANALLLRKLHAGAWSVASAYGLLLGVAMGGLVYLVTRRGEE